MNNIKLTKKAFLASLVALVLCFAMLLGTTYAWFTDSVSSANNIIQSGNLDVELYWSKDATNWKKVDENTNVFSGELWEPGYVEVVYLKVANEGSLALKYKLGVNVESEIQGKKADGQIFKLSDYIEFDVIEDVNTAFKDRSEAIAAVDKGKVISAGYSKVTALEKKGDTDYLAMVVYMPTTVGNEVNHDGINVPSINLGISLVATQLSYEEDSYGKDYDMDALPCDVIATPDTIDEVLANAKEGDVIGLANGEYYDMSIVIPQNNITLISNTAIVDHVNVNGKNNVKLIGLTFDAYAPRAVVDPKNGETSILSNITSAEGNKGPENLQIIDCKFVDLYNVSAGLENYCPIAIYDRQRVSGASNGVLIDGCTFDTNASYYVYMYYPGDPNISPTGDIVIKNNTFGSTNTSVSTALYIGGTKNNVSVVGNTFINGTVVITPHNNASCTYSLKMSIIDNNFINTTDETNTVIALRNFHSLPKCSVTVKNNVANYGLSELSAPYIDADSYECYDINGNEIVAVEIGNTSVLSQPNKVYYLSAGDYGQVPEIGSGSVVIGSEGTVFATHLDSLSYKVLDNVTFKNVTFSGNSASYGTAINGTVTFENCEFNASANGYIHFNNADTGKDTVSDSVVFTNCKFSGWTVFGKDIEKVEFNECYFTDNGRVGGLRNYQNAVANECTFSYAVGMGGITPVEGTLTLNDCVNLNGSLDDIIDSSASGSVIK